MALLLLVICSAPVAVAQGATPPPEPTTRLDIERTLPRPLDFTPFQNALDAMDRARRAEIEALILEQPITAITEEMAAGRLTSKELVTFYLHRIQTFDDNQLNSVIELNPQALEIASQRDLERERGVIHGPLHGIPVLLKDNIATGDLMRTTAGAAALSNVRAHRDAFLVKQLREAGAVILGKTNLTEWANWMHGNGANGYSAVGGQTFSPYGQGVEPGGSSTGSAVAVTANFTALAIGTETMGSVIGPAARNSIVGMHPSLGLVSRDMIIPLSDDLDTAGPMGRYVADAALALTVFASTLDEADPAAREAAALRGTDFTEALDPEALAGVRIGIWGTDPHLSDLENIWRSGLAAEVDLLEAAGAEIVVVFKEKPAYASWEPLLDCGLRDGAESFLAETDSLISGLDEIVAFNYRNASLFMPYGQARLEMALWCDASAEDLEWIATTNRENARAFIGELFNEFDIDALATTDEVFSVEYSLAGAPAITVPRGTWGAGGQPTGLTFIGRYLSDFELIGYAYAFEAASQLRVPPRFETTPFLDPVVIWRDRSLPQASSYR